MARDNFTTELRKRVQERFGKQTERNSSDER
jgi:hypothetical protein